MNRVRREGHSALHLDVFEVKHISLDKCVSNLLIGPRYEELVVVVGLETGGQW